MQYVSLYLLRLRASNICLTQFIQLSNGGQTVGKLFMTVYYLGWCSHLNFFIQWSLASSLMMGVPLLILLHHMLFLHN